MKNEYGIGAAGGKSIFDLNKAMKANMTLMGEGRVTQNLAKLLGYQTQGDLGPKILVDHTQKMGFWSKKAHSSQAI